VTLPSGERTRGLDRALVFAHGTTRPGWNTMLIAGRSSFTLAPNDLGDHPLSDPENVDGHRS